VASKSLVKWLKILWENWRASAWRVVCCYSAFCVLCRVSLSPAAGEFVFLL
jgi:hypothetical protein